MTRSGIKRGLAVSAVSALSIVGLPAAAHAAAPTYTITESASSVSVNETVTFVVKATSGTGADASISATESVAAGAPAATVTVTDDDVTTATGETMTVKSDTAGTVVVTIVDSNGTNHVYNVTVGGGKHTPADVAAVNASNSSFTLYQADLATAKLTVRPADSAGFGVQGVTVLDTVDGTAGASKSTTTSSYTLDESNLLSGLSVGTHVIKFWVDLANNGDTAGVQDADEKSATVTVNVLANPTYTSTSLVPAGGTDLSGAGDFTNVFPAYAPATAGGTFTLKNGTDPVAGASVRFDVYSGAPKASGGGYVISLSGTTDAKGTITLSAPISADQAKVLAAAGTGGLYVQTYISKSSTKSDGIDLGSTEIAKFEAAAFSAKLQGATSPLQATVGSTVNVNLIAADQFGKAAAGDVFTVANDTAAGTSKNTTPAAPNDRLAVTSASGQTTYTYKDTKAAVGDSDYLVFTDLNTGAVAHVVVNFVKSVTPAAVVGDGTAGTTNFANAQDDTVGATATHEYDVLVTDADGNPLTNQKVSFTVDNGFVTKAANAKGTSKSVEVMTDGSGLATAYAGSEKSGTQVVTATAGTAKALVSKVSTYSAAQPYSAKLTGPTNVVSGQTAQFTVSVTDEFGNLSGNYTWNEYDQANSGITGVGYILSQPGSWDTAVGVKGTGTFVVGTNASDKGTGTLTAAIEFGSWASAEDKDNATVPFTKVDPTTGDIVVTANYTVAPAVTHPTPAEQDLATDTAKLSKDKAALASATSKLAKAQAKLAKDKKALKHAKGAKKKALKKAVKALKKAVAADKKAVSAANSAVTADNKAIAADKAAIAAGK